jgi:hypothetical protein
MFQGQLKVRPAFWSLRKPELAKIVNTPIPDEKLQAGEPLRVGQRHFLPFFNSTRVPFPLENATSTSFISVFRRSGLFSTPFFSSIQLLTGTAEIL